LPTADQMMAEIKVHESSLDKVSLDLPVKVSIDAIPGRRFTGRVTKIAPLPDAASMWLNPDLKVYTTRIVLDGSHRDLRTGMSCQAQIIVERLQDAVHVPVQTVVRVGNQPTVYVKKGDNVEPRAVELGMDNNRMAHIKSGLEEGERVLLSPPLSAATATLNESESEEEEIDDAPASKVKPGEDAKPQAAKKDGDRRRGRRDRGGGGQADAMRKRFESMTPEQREQMRKQFQNMTPEQREQMRKQYSGGGQ
jgi:HlyD family secretion protein